MFEQCVERDADPDWGEADIDDIAECERIIWSTQARQAKSIVDLFEKRLKLVHKTHMLADGQIAQSVIAEVAMARHVAASTAANQFGFALGLKRLPATQGLFTDGVISERVARAVVNETGGLTPTAIATIDDELAPKLPTLTAKRAAAAARKLAIGLDPDGAQHVTNAARSERHISIHALPHSMASIRMNLPAEQAAALYQALDDYAQGLKYEGDPRSGSQIMSDTAVERITGQSKAGDIAVEIGLLMTPGALLADEDIPALLAGYGPLPAAIGRQLAAGSKTWLRRLFTDPITGDLTNRDKTRRRFDGPLAAFVRERDQHCGRPWCDCRIRDLDHIDPYNGANTTADNAQGLCKRSHTTKHLPRWKIAATKTGSIWTTPTGHHYDTTRPKLGGDSPQIGKPKILPNESATEYQLSKTIGHSIMHRRQ